MVLAGERTEIGSLSSANGQGLVVLAPYLEKMVREGSGIVYVPGKLNPTRDEIEAYELARTLGVPMYSMCLERIDRAGLIPGDITKYDLRELFSHPLLILNGIFANWYSDSCRLDVLARGVNTLQRIMPHTNSALLLYVEQDARRFAGENSDITIAKFMREAITALDNIDVIDFCTGADRHLLFHRS